MGFGRVRAVAPERRSGVTGRPCGSLRQGDSILPAPPTVVSAVECFNHLPENKIAEADLRSSPQLILFETRFRARLAPQIMPCLVWQEIACFEGHDGQTFGARPELQHWGSICIHGARPHCYLPRILGTPTADLPRFWTRRSKPSEVPRLPPVAKNVRGAEKRPVRSTQVSFRSNGRSASKSERRHSD